MEVEVEPPHAHHPTGSRKLDLILPIAALFVSVLSIYLAWDNAKVMQDLVHQNERLVQANSMPRLSHSIRTYSGGDADSRIVFRLSNDGVGPAEIRSIEMTLDGKPVRSPDELLQRFGINGGPLSVARVENSMLRPGESIEYFKLDSAPAIARPVSEMIAGSGQGRYAVRVCYCSVFEECWTLEGNHARPRAAAQCAAPKSPYQ